ncbi:cellulose biosynthesis cyclic di-GMP-binding regulatory protein BcsB [Buttiauxella noackiae]|uniref:cellulose biosynthesis cyclic di-GMP-binding regulatory protein BcsB n=1 Tax=Buttiauxella noackiae TaxID=82992 RepID=UPI0035A64A82
MKRMTYTVCQLLLAFSVLTSPVMAEEPTTVESLLPVDLPAPGQEAVEPQDSMPAPETVPVPDPVQAPTSTPAPAAAPSVFVPGSVSSITMAQMGQPRGITLSGGQLQAGIDFTLPSDQVITNAQLALNLKVSPAMAARNTTLQLMMNGQPLGTVPLGSADSDVSSYQLEIPAAMVVSSNNISFKINDGDALLCLRDLSEKYQVTIMPNTRLDLEGQQLNIGADLSHFPRPFFDAMQMTPASVTFAFPAKTLPEQVSAAALVASWLGIEADYRGISFNALRDTLPEKNGILFGKSGEQIGGLTLPETQKPMLQIIDNPGNPVYKLLLVVGNSDQQLRAAAWRLTHGKFPGQTASTLVENQTIPVSKAYDAPRWIPTDRPVRLTELMRKDQSLTATGIWHEPLSVAFRAAPDLFLWDGETIPVKIGYRFPTESWIDEDRSYLSLTFNGTFLHNLPVNKQGALETLWRKVGGDARQEDYNLALEPYLIYGDNQLSLYFNIQTKETAPCSVLLNNNIKSRIDENSSIDLSKTRHFSLLPNLSYFVGASFPFSRFADFAHTVLLLPENPGEAEISTLLNMAARSGNATGTSLNNNVVMFGVPTAGGNLQRLEESHVLAVSTINKNTFNRTLLAQSPFTSNEHSFGVRERSIWQKVQSWLEGDWGSTGIAADRYFSSNEAWRGFVSFRSQWNPNRVVVMAIGSTDEQLSRLQTDLASARINAGIRGDASIITDENGVRSFRVGQQFPSGQMPWYMMVVWYANQHSALLAILGLLFATVIGLSLYALLKKRAHKRLNPQDDGK